MLRPGAGMLRSLPPRLCSSVGSRFSDGGGVSGRLRDRGESAAKAAAAALPARRAARPPLEIRPPELSTVTRGMWRRVLLLSGVRGASASALLLLFGRRLDLPDRFLPRLLLRLLGLESCRDLESPPAAGPSPSVLSPVGAGRCSRALLAVPL